MKALRLALVSFLALLPLAAASEESKEEKKQFSGMTTVVAVEVPVHVVLGGEPVRGLTAESFQLFDGDQAKELTGVEVIDLEVVGVGAESPGSPTEAGWQTVRSSAQRHFLLLFDLSFSRTKTLVRSVDAARQLLAAKLHPADRVAVGVFGLAGGARVLVNFTTDRRQVEYVLDVLELMLDRDLDEGDLAAHAARGAGDPLRLIAGDMEAVAADIGRAAGAEITIGGQILPTLLATDNRGGGLLIAYLASLDESMSNELRERRRAEVTALTEGLAVLARLTRGIAGQKHLVYFSEGFEEQLLADRGSSMFHQQLERSFEELRRAGWVIHSVDSGGVRDHLDEDFGTLGGLVYLAEETGGEVYQNFNDLGVAMERLLEATEVTYLLTFQTGEIPLDGAFHPLRVRLVDGPRKAKVRHRSGYYAPRHAVEQGVSERAFETADLLLAGDEGGELDLEVLAVPFRAGESYDVAVWMETDGAKLLGNRYSGVLETEVYVYALDERGEIRDFFTREVKLDTAKARDHLQRGHLKLYGDLRLDPGRYRLRILLRDLETGRYALRGVPVEVKDLSGAEMVLFDPVFFADPEDPSVVIREKQPESGAAVDRYPFRVGESPYFPAVRPVVAAGREARISLMAYGLDPDLHVSALVLKGDGSPVELERLVAAGKDRRDGLEQILWDFRSAGLEPGEYTLQVALRDPDSEKTYRRSSSFRLVE